MTTTPWAGLQDERTIVLGGGAAFGDGSHESTRMCLQALAAFAPRHAFRLLDVGSGTGILSIAAVKLGGEAVGIDVDDGSNAIADGNARRNGVEARATFSRSWPDGGFEVVVSNIGRPVLVALAPAIVARLLPSATLILSGLVSTDVPAIVACYAPLLGGLRPEVFDRDEWRTVVWRIYGGAHGS